MGKYWCKILGHIKQIIWLASLPVPENPPSKFVLIIFYVKKIFDLCALHYDIFIPALLEISLLCLVNCLVGSFKPRSYQGQWDGDRIYEMRTFKIEILLTQFSRWLLSFNKMIKKKFCNMAKDMIFVNFQIIPY